jgi:SPP1 family phage portal protein
MSNKQRFSNEANIHYRYSSADKLIANLEDLSDMVQHHMQYQRPRLQTLENYYKGNNETILQANRRKEEHLADHRATHNFAKYVSQFIQGYMVGIPLKTSHKEETINEKLRDINRINDADEHNSDLVLNQSIYGRAYELLYRNKRDEIRFTALDVKETFVVYDDTVEMNPIAGVRYFNNQFNDDTLNVIVYTDNKKYEFVTKDQYSYKLTLRNEENHFFDGVPIIEYMNNKFRQGDYEDVLNLIDLYDAAQSDTANYMTDLNDAYLVIQGNVDLDLETAEKMKEARLILLQTEPGVEGKASQADAKYIYKQYDVSGTEAYKDRLAEDIHKFTNTPNLNDEHFSGTQSGESMKYKLFGLEQVRSIKERLFKKALRDRYRLINNVMTRASEGGFDVNDIQIVFTPNLPKSLKEEIEMFIKLGGKLSEETTLSVLSLVENPKEELEKIEAENKLNQPTYDFEQFRNQDEEEEGEEE